MQISTRSKFYYGFIVDSSNRYLNFSEGGGEETASLSPGSYTLTSLMVEVQKQLNAIGSNTYTVSVDRSSRKVTIAANANFDLLCNTGTQASVGPWDLLGFDTASDKTGADTYTGENASGSEYKPQFVLQNYVSDGYIEDRVQPSINESASGKIEVVSFGVRQFIEFNIKYINELDQVGQIVMENDPAAIANAQAFLRFVTRRDPIEIMPDRSDSNTFLTIQLDTTRQSSKGVGYRLGEMSGLKGYFETGLLKWRVKE